MDPAIIPATSGLVGSLLGGVSTFAASWLSTRNQYRAHTLVQQAVRRETLYAEFAAEAAARLAEAWSHEAGGPEVIARLSGAVARMRLTSSAAVIAAAEQVVRQVVEAYASPNHTFNDLRRRVQAPGSAIRCATSAKPGSEPATREECSVSRQRTRAPRVGVLWVYLTR